ncbi:MAG: type 4a pilus biogenesis protein PilO [Candidatus Peregrinibacteria bacterium]|nr:type 4a pilus biogenesis protein PilO [Candidatus Peregrinibacteria bacterium]MDZ4244549.1 type 4a pilus biogenesis protein PilO [Candidatus Gracilibacteria bacterium]
MQNKKNIISLILVLAILVVYMYYIQPSRGVLAQDTQNLVASEQKLNDLKNSVAELESLKASIPESAAQRQLLLAQVPTEVDQDGLIKDLNRLAQSRGIELKNIGFSLAKADPNTKVGVITMSTGFEGTYQDLINLLADIEKNARRMRVKNISVQVLEVSRDVSANVTFTLAIESYYQE